MEESRSTSYPNLRSQLSMHDLDHLKKGKKGMKKIADIWYFAEQIETCWSNNACCPVRALEWAQLATLVSPTIYPVEISFMISLALLLNFLKGSGWRRMALRICSNIFSFEPPWFTILLKRPIAEDKKSEYMRVQRAILRNSDIMEP